MHPVVDDSEAVPEYPLLQTQDPDNASAFGSKQVLHNVSLVHAAHPYPQG
jgi:hypothetical protein